MSIVDDYAAIQKRRIEMEAEAWPPASTPAWRVTVNIDQRPFSLDLSAVKQISEWMLQAGRLTPEELRQVEDELRNAAHKFWAERPLIKHPDGSYSLVEPPPPPPLLPPPRDDADVCPHGLPTAGGFLPCSACSSAEFGDA